MTAEFIGKQVKISFTGLIEPRQLLAFRIELPKAYRRHTASLRKAAILANRNSEKENVSVNGDNK